MPAPPTVTIQPPIVGLGFGSDPVVASWNGHSLDLTKTIGDPMKPHEECETVGLKDFCNQNPSYWSFFLPPSSRQCIRPIKRCRIAQPGQSGGSGAEPQLGRIALEPVTQGMEHVAGLAFLKRQSIVNRRLLAEFI